MRINIMVFKEPLKNKNKTLFSAVCLFIYYLTSQQRRFSFAQTNIGRFLFSHSATMTTSLDLNTVQPSGTLKHN